MSDKKFLDVFPPVTDVASYISAINLIVSEDPNFKGVYVFRGEPQYRETYCTPGIFRKNVLNENLYYEKSLLNTLRHNKLTTKDSYLENAIDAQHGEFPSRLLDVTYNCLNALYFAVTPFYRKNERMYDNKDGIVYVFCVEEIYSPSAKNVKDCYDAIIDKNKEWFKGQPIFGKNHKFIDHAKLNDRIIAQQGAFILFQGEDVDKLPAYMVKGFSIPSSSKEKIRKELSLMFGINTASIYPEIFNEVNELTEKSKNLVTDTFCWENEIDGVLRNLQKELDFYLNELYLEDDTDKQCKLSYHVETIINSYRVGLIKFYNDYDKCSCMEASKSELEKRIEEYDKKVKAFIEQVQIICGANVKISSDLIIKEKRC